MALWAVGAIINVIGSILINLGTNIIKLGHTRTAVHKDGHNGESAPKLLRSPKQWWRYPGKKVWLWGMSMFVVGNLLNFASFAFAAQSLLSALGVVQFISNIIFGRFVNKEKVTKRVVFATAVVCTGCVLLVSFGNHESPTLSTHDMLELYSEPLYITYLCVIFTASPAFYAVYRAGKRAILADFSGRAAQRWARWLPISYALFAGPIGTQSVLYGKTISMLLRTTFSGDSQLGNWYTWLSLLLFLVFAGFWMSRYSKAMKLFPVLIIMPIIQIVWILFSMISGSIYFQEYKTLTALSGTMFGVGAVIQLVGVWLLTGGKPPEAQPSAPDLKIELTEEERERVDELDEAALRSKSPLSDNLEVVTAPALLEPEEAMVARKLSTIYERQTGSLTGRPSWRPSSAPAQHGIAEGSEAGEATHAQLMEEGAVDSAAVQEGATPSAAAAAAGLPGAAQAAEGGAAGAAAAAAGAAGEAGGAAVPAPSLMHDIVADWGVGMRDLGAVMRASVAVYQDDDEETAFSIWSMPIATSFTSARRHSVDAPPRGMGAATFRVRSALDRQYAQQLSPGGGAVDDGMVGSARGRRPGHRRLNRSRSANELDDMLREAQLLDAEQHAQQLELAAAPSGGTAPSTTAAQLESPWGASSTAGTGAVAAGASPNGGISSAPGTGPHHARTPSPGSHLRLGSAPVLSAVALGGDAAAGQAGGRRVPMLSTPGSAPRRPFTWEQPQGQQPMSPAFSGGSAMEESEGAAASGGQAALTREGGVPASEFLDVGSFSPGSSMDIRTQLSSRKGDKAE